MNQFCFFGFFEGSIKRQTGIPMSLLRPYYQLTEAATRGVLCKRVFLKISQNSQENTCARVSFLKKRLWHRCFPVNFVKFLRAPFLQNTSEQLLLNLAFLKVVLFK